ncbi:hypothetical protein AQUCO_01000229v1 [Aquilegia coerulea]|uniref:Uncharacterized protein n=1 Tax=Aquilegia coerulea TaxID=218851 RepID=A0A2G5E8X9_AQUCA|nr:hypothetical protein AQUCO_01000229v1 [Aquilegia coerulea]
MYVIKILREATLAFSNEKSLHDRPYILAITTLLYPKILDQPSNRCYSIQIYPGSSLVITKQASLQDIQKIHI